MDALEQEVTEALRRVGARFGFVHGSRAGAGPPGSRPPRRDAALEVAAWWGGELPEGGVPGLPAAVDLLVLDGAPPEVAGRVAHGGRLLFDDDPPARLAWEAQTRLVYTDEEERQRAIDKLFFPGVRRRDGW